MDATNGGWRRFSTSGKKNLALRKTTLTLSRGFIGLCEFGTLKRKFHLHSYESYRDREYNFLYQECVNVII